MWRIMKDFNNKQSREFLTQVFGVAKKLSDVGLDAIQQATTQDVSKQSFSVDALHVIDGQARAKKIFEANVYGNPQQMLRSHVPQVSRQLLGRHYGKVDRVVNLVSPQFSEKVSDYFFDQLNTFTNNISSVDALLDETGIQNLEELTKDLSRSQRISQAFAEQNKWIASVQGAFTGATGVVGSTIDVPLSIVMSLRTIYQVGRSYGFELNKETEQDIIQYIFRQIDLGLIAEKQAILMGLKAIANTLETHDVHQLQKLIGSSNDIEALKKWLTNADGEAKWQWLNTLPKFSMLNKLTPVASASVSAVYSWKLIEEVNAKAQVVFAQARAYLIEHKDLILSPMDAYQKSVELLSSTSPKLVEHLKTTAVDANVVDIKSKSETIVEQEKQYVAVKKAPVKKPAVDKESVKKTTMTRVRGEGKSNAKLNNQVVATSNQPVIKNRKGIQLESTGKDITKKL